MKVHAPLTVLSAAPIESRWERWACAINMLAVHQRQLTLADAVNVYEVLAELYPERAAHLRRIGRRRVTGQARAEVLEFIAWAIPALEVSGLSESSRDTNSRTGALAVALAVKHSTVREWLRLVKPEPCECTSVYLCDTHQRTN